IDLRVTAELSEPDTTISQVQVGGFIIPGFKSRQTSTRVRLRAEQSLLIAGLLRDDQVEEERKVPYLGDVPYLGALFRTTSFAHQRSELMILVRPTVSSPERDDASRLLPTERGPLTRGEVRTQTNPHEVTRPRLFDRKDLHWGLGPGSEQPPAQQPGTEPSGQ